LRGWPFPLAFPGPILGLSRFPQSRPCGVLWSARYPCQLHLTALMDLTAPPTLSLVGAAIRLRSLLSISGGFFRLPSRLRGWRFPLTCPGSVVGPSRFPQARPCGVLRSARYPCRKHLAASCGLDSTPDFFAHRCGLELSLSAYLISIHSDQAPFDGLFRLLSPLSRLAFSTHVSWTRRRPVSLSSVETLRRALVCTLPLSAPPFGFLWT